MFEKPPGSGVWYVRYADATGNTSEWVFPNATGTAPLDGRDFDRLVFRPAPARAGVAGFRWKDSHTFATRLRMESVDLKSIGELMGHTTTRMTERCASGSPCS